MQQWLMTFKCQFKGKSNLEESGKYKDIDDYMSDLKEGKLTSRDYVVNADMNTPMSSINRKTLLCLMYYRR